MKKKLFFALLIALMLLPAISLADVTINGIVLEPGCFLPSEGTDATTVKPADNYAGLLQNSDGSCVLTLHNFHYTCPNEEATNWDVPVVIISDYPSVTLKLEGSNSITTTKHVCMGIDNAPMIIEGSGSLKIDAVRGILQKDFSRTDLTINSGSLTFDVDGDAIAVNKLTVNGGSIKTESDFNALSATGGLVITDGSIDIKLRMACLQAMYISPFAQISGGSIKIAGAQSTGQGLHVDGPATITGGTFDIETKLTCLAAYHGLDISGGSFKLKSSENGITTGDSDMNISGGQFVVDSLLFCLLSEGDLNITGGRLDLRYKSAAARASGAISCPLPMTVGAEIFTRPNYLNQDVQYIDFPDAYDGESTDLRNVLIPVALPAGPAADASVPPTGDSMPLMALLALTLCALLGAGLLRRRSAR